MVGSFVLLLSSFLGSVQTVPPHCAVWSPSLSCLICDEGRTPDVTGRACQVCQLSDCGSCPDPAVCDACRSGYRLESGYCQPCSSYKCVSCELVGGAEECQSCESLYYVVQADPSRDCLYCPSTCTQCDGIELEGSATCTACLSGYFLQDGTCASCAPDCSACSSTTVCAQCGTGFGLLEDACVQCTESYVAMCNVSGSGSQAVLECLSRYEYVDTPTCYACSPSCTNCSELACFECESDYVLTDGVCYACPVGCHQCYNLTACIQCHSGFVLTADGSCDACPANCSACTDVTFCSECLPRSLLADGLCVDCPEGCANCTLDAGSNSTVCSYDSCLDLYAYNPDGCEPCSNNCALCVYNASSESNDCVTCILGHAFNSSALCVPCPASCQNCSVALESGSGAVVCDPGSCSEFYTFNSNTNSCVSCQADCAACVYNASTNNSTCLACRDQFGLDLFGWCSSCPASCAACLPNATNIMTCVYCVASHHLYVGCTPCPSGCLQCVSTTSGLSCVQCEQGYVLYSAALTTCVKCSWSISGCVSCYTGSNGYLTCYECASGYSLSTDGTRCLHCAPIQNCAYCRHDGEVCDVCDSGYLLDNTTLSCTRGCYQCSGNWSSDGYGSYSQCGGSMLTSGASYDLIPCPTGACTASVRIDGGVRTYQRNCSSEVCQTTASYRVCTQWLDTGVMQCSRCCEAGGCNDFILPPLTIQGSDGSPPTRLPLPPSVCALLAVIQLNLV